MPEALEERADGKPGLKARQRSAKAEVDAAAERLMVHVPPRHVEAVGFRVNLRIPISGGEEHDHRLAANSLVRSFPLPFSANQRRRYELRHALCGSVPFRLFLFFPPSGENSPTSDLAPFLWRDAFPACLATFGAALFAPLPPEGDRVGIFLARHRAADSSKREASAR
jgi:hypothetical protein